MIAAKGGHLEILMTLLQAGVYVNLQDEVSACFVALLYTKIVFLYTFACHVVNTL